MKFKVGDKVRIIGDSLFGEFKIGEIGVVSKLAIKCYDGESRIVVDFEDGSDGLFKAENLELAKKKKSKNQRITELEKQVASLLGRVEALENVPKTMRDTLDEVFAEPSAVDEVQAQDEIIEFEGNQYRKVNREACEGDVVVLRKTTSECYKNDKPYKVLQELKIADDYGGTLFGLYAKEFNRTPETVDVYELFAYGTPEKSPNQLRAEIIEKAKKFVDETVAYGRSSDRYKSEGNSTYRSNFYDVDFFVKGNKVTAVIYWLRGNVTRVEKPEHVGRAKCAPGDVFNEHIGKAIALGRALGLDVSEFEQAVQPTHYAVGQIAISPLWPSYPFEVIKIGEGEVFKKLFEPYTNSFGNTNIPLNFEDGKYKSLTIINDTNAKYEEVE